MNIAINDSFIPIRRNMRIIEKDYILFADQSTEEQTVIER